MQQLSPLTAQILSSADIDQVLQRPGGANYWENDCACAPSVVAALAPAAAFSAGTVFRRVNPLYEDRATLPGYRIVFNPIAGEGVTVLDTHAAAVLDSLDGAATLETVQARYNATFPASAADIGPLLARLAAQALVYSGPTAPQPRHTPPDHMGIWLHVTNQCNLRCTYCYIGKTDEHLSLGLGRRALRSIFATARERGMRELTLKYAGGEALLEADLICALDGYAYELAAPDLRLKSIILTNGTPLRPPLVARLAAAGFQLAVSLDGLGAAHDAQRPTRTGRPSFAAVQRGLETAQAAGLEINVSVVVGPGNLAALPELIDYLLDRELRFSLTFLRDNSEAQAHLSDQDALLIAGMEVAYARIARRPPAFSLMNAALDRVQLQYPHFAACGMGESYVVVKHTGEVASCQMNLARPVGHLREGNLLEMVAHRTPERPHGTTVDDHEGCRTCQWRYRCAGGCPIVTFQTHKRFDRRSPFCGVYQTLIPQLVALEGLRIARYGGLGVDAARAAH